MKNDTANTKTQTQKDWKKKLGTLFTLSRIAMTPGIVFFLVSTELFDRWMAFGLFILASITDYLDGHYARKHNGVSTLGKFLDPLADKVLVTSVLIMLLFKNSIDPYLVILVVVRDQLIGGLRSIAAAENLIIDAKPTGKWKTALQMTAIPILILKTFPFTEFSIETYGYVLLWISVILSLWSGVEYLLLYLKNTSRPR